MGGTQRLPRLVGMERAIDLMCTGKTLLARDAHAAGLADAVVPPGQLLDAATALALELASGTASRRKTLQLAQHMQKEGEGFAVAAAAVVEAHGRAAKQYPGQPQYGLLLEAVAAGLAHGTPAGLQKVRCLRGAVGVG